DITKINDEYKLLLPGKENGITLFDLIDQLQQVEVLSHPGKINSAIVEDRRVFTGGGGNPLEVYEIIGGSLHPPLRLREAVTGVADLSISGDFLLALYAYEQKLFVFDISRANEITDAIDTLPVSIANALELNLCELPDNLTPFLTVENKNQIELFAGASGSYEPETVWTFDKPIADAKIVDGKLFVTDRFETITAYSILDDYSLDKCAERNLTGTGWEMAEYNDKLFVFTGNTLTTFDNCLELDTIVRLSSFVLDAEIKNDTLYTVGPDGIAKYDLQSGLPVLADLGGLKGSQISVENGTIATTDGSSINIYFGENIESDGGNGVARDNGLKLYENYPEPFNSSTTIQFELPTSTLAELSIFNLLGQRVRVLINRTFDAGVHKVSWDGKDELGGDVSSGIYFYRLTAGTDVISKKMILIK
ncbi:MAG TPA: T9SS type A sorting domain-containing protein, partial [candidate division Zixibacteria bacterium]|nr:T9SS type A sorting domain-containing protein [candidate division Zixibacteria bacterium]